MCRSIKYPSSSICFNLPRIAVKSPKCSNVWNVAKCTKILDHFRSCNRDVIETCRDTRSHRSVGFLRYRWLTTLNMDCFWVVIWDEGKLLQVLNSKQQLWIFSSMEAESFFSWIYFVGLSKRVKKKRPHPRLEADLAIRGCMHSWRLLTFIWIWRSGKQFPGVLITKGFLHLLHCFNFAPITQNCATTTAGWIMFAFLISNISKTAFRNYKIRHFVKVRKARLWVDYVSSVEFR